MYDAIIRVLRRSSANDEPRFVAEGQRITIDFAGLDTALTTSGVERSSSFAAIERRYPAMRFVFDSSAAPCASGDVLAACRVQAGASTVRFEDPVADARETFTFLMVVTDVVGQRAESEPQATAFEMTMERRASVWMLMRAEIVTAP